MDQGASLLTHPLMEYLPTQPHQRHDTLEANLDAIQREGGAHKYFGKIAAGYDAKREQTPKWVCEQRLIEGMLSDLPQGSVVLDCPVGTGRFLDFYKAKGLQFVGVDLSGDMLVQSALKLAPESDVEKWVAACNAKNTIMPFRVPGKGVLVNGDVRQLTGLPDKSVDASVMCRLTRWLSPDDCRLAMRELQRVTRKRIIWTARVANHPHARAVELFEQALGGWKIARNEAGHELDFRVLMAEPA